MHIIGTLEKITECGKDATISTYEMYKHVPTCIPDICHGPTGRTRGEKICHVEKFQISVHET